MFFLPIFHRDIKSSNTLLDENFLTVILDFGLSRSVLLDKSHETTRVGDSERAWFLRLLVLNWQTTQG
ncbi:unnamed protein product [Coffea canephora]|uniref:Protein kinase domain-containing protein n=1 Tax=Coffea canephora TaxID=49390 RepID=A0A068V9V9_COFCA|nr:unnamed protein product [Coffea canephora]